MKAIVSQTTTDYPKIKPTPTGAEVTFEIYEVSLDYLRGLVGKELELEIKDNESK